MAEISLHNDIFFINGDLSYHTVNMFHLEAQSLFAKNKDITVDFSAIKKCDSAALALIIEWIKHAKMQQKKLTLISFPSRLASLARAAHIDQLILPFCHHDDADEAAPSRLK